MFLEKAELKTVATDEIINKIIKITKTYHINLSL